VLFSAQSGTLRICGTNLEVGVEVTVPARVLADGVCAVPAQILTNIMSATPSGAPIILEHSGSTLRIRSGSRETTINTLATDDFPRIPQVSGGAPFDIAAATLLDGLRSVWYGAATSPIKPELASVFVQHKDGLLYFVATDAFRLAEKRLPAPGIDGDIPPVLIPAKNIPDIMRAFEGADGVVSARISSSQISVEGNGVYFTTRVVDGSFPDYEKVIPTRFTAEATLLKGDLVDAMKMSGFFTDTMNHVRIDARPAAKQLIVNATNGDIGAHTDALTAAVSGEDATAVFNHRYILDGLQSVHADSVTVSFGGAGKPMLMRGVADDTFRYIVMPINTAHLEPGGRASREKVPA
jgi:DNA polymerase-3 subunit beta